MLAVSAVCLAGLWGIWLCLNMEKPEEGLGWQQTDTEIPEDSERFAEICEALDRELGSGKLYMESVVTVPWEYEVWEELKLIFDLDYQALSGEEQLLYDRLKYCYDLYLRWQNLPDYTPLLSEISGVLNRVPEAFYTSSFSSKEDIEVYLGYLSQVSALLEELGERLCRQESLGVIYAEEVIAQQLILCEELAGEESIFLTSFAYKLEECDFLSEGQKAQFRQKNEELVRQEIGGALAGLREKMEQLLRNEEAAGLCVLEKGVEFYEYLLEVNTGSGMSARELYVYLERKKSGLLKEMQEHGETENAGSILIRGKSGTEILKQLMAYQGLIYPQAEYINCQLRRMPEFLSGTLYAGFYTRGLSGTENSIYVNPALTDELQLYQVLVHEAVPGHMYWYNYDRNQCYPFLDAQIKCPGYNEGWAVYAEFAAGVWLGEERTDYQRMIRKKLFDELVLCQADIGINGLGWDKEKLREYLVDCYGEKAAEVANDVWRTVTCNPACYESYVVGFFQLKDMEVYAEKTLGMEAEDFLDRYLAIGQAPVEIIKSYLNSKFDAQAKLSQ